MPALQGWQRGEPLPPSGSERRLFRVYRSATNGTTLSAILVDARQEKEKGNENEKEKGKEEEEKVDTSSHAPYVQRLQVLTSFLQQTGLRVPRIEAVDHARSLAVMEDLGENSYARCLNLRGVEGCYPLFQRALDGLIRLSRIDARNAPEILPAFNEERFVEQTMPFADAFLAKKQHLVWQELWRDTYRNAAFCDVELAPVLGDVHIENVFALSNDDRFSEGEDKHGESCVFIDFQDAHIAPRCYDVVSLLEDGLWSMPAAQRERLWTCYKKAHAKRAAASASRHYALCALHREVRMIGILYRLSRLRGEERYGAWLKTTMRRCRRRLTAHARFASIRQFLERSVGFAQEGWEQKGRTIR